MITPNIAPRKITGSAAAGLFSAAKSSIRRMEKTTDAISKAPDVTKEQKFGINYVQFFGSKKNSKILKKSLKSIRDSLVATFEIAKLLRSEVSKNVKLIGEKTKGKKGFFGLGLGGILGLVSLLANPLVLSVLGIGAGIAGGFALFDFLKNNRGEIIKFVMDKASGLYNTLQGLVARILRDFFGDRFKEAETRNLEIESENNIEETMDELLGKDKKTGKFINPDMTRGEARVEATQIELKRLEDRRDELKDKERRTSKEDDELEATRKRIEQLRTGKNIFDKTPNVLGGGFIKNFFQEEFQRERVFLKDNENYLKMSDEKKLEKIKGLIGNFRSKGNSMDRILEIYTRAMENEDLSPDQQAQAIDIINYANRDDSRTRAQRKKNKQDPNITPDNFSFYDANNLEASFFDDTDLARVNKGRIHPKILEKYPDLDPTNARDYMKLKRLQRNATDLDLPLASNGGVNGKPNLSQVPVEASSSPTCRYYSNFDGDNDLPGFNRSLLCIT